MVKTWAPVGQTPIVPVPLRREHLSVIGGITLEGRLFTWVQDHSVKGPDCVFFLHHLLRQIPGKVLVIWDGLPAHRSNEVKRFLTDHAANRLWLIRLPAYAPELNPIEALWSYLKQVELKNLCCHTLDLLRAQLRLAVERVRHKTWLILNFFKQQACYL